MDVLGQKPKPGPLKVTPEVAKAIVDELERNPPPLRKSLGREFMGEREGRAVSVQKTPESE